MIFQSFKFQNTEKMKHKNFIFAWLVLLLASVSTSAQKTKPVLFDKATKVIKLTDGTYLGVGYAFNTRQTSRNAWVVKTDTLADVHWQYTSGASLGSVASSVIETSDNSYIIGGTSFGRGKKSNLFVLKLNAKGKKVWKKTYNFSEKEELLALSSAKGNSILMLSSELPLKSQKQILNIVKLDSLGKQIWKTSIDDGEIFNKYIKRSGADICETSDGNILIAGSKFSYTDRKSKLWIMKITPKGKKQWEETYNDYAHAVRFAENGISYDLFALSQPDKYFKQKLSLLSVDAFGKTALKQKYPESVRPAVECITPIDGSLEYTSFTRMAGTKNVDFWKTEAQKRSARTSKTLLFERAGQVVLSKEEEAKLLRDIESFKKASYIFVEGFTDATGTFETNLRISQKRFLSVENVLAKNGVSPGKVIGKPYGNTKAEINEQTKKEGKDEDRKVVIHIY